MYPVNPEVAGSNPALVSFSLFIQNVSTNVPSQFSLWFITGYFSNVARVFVSFCWFVGFIFVISTLIKKQFILIILISVFTIV